MRTVVIVGRPNVGKSTLFNRLVGKRLALVDDLPGVTRDRREAVAEFGDLKFRLVDTAGYEDAKGSALETRMRAQTEAALAEADMCLFVIDGRAGLTALDEDIATVLRQSERPTLLLVNKCEGKAGDAGLYEAFSLGLGEPLAISAEHGEGVGELLGQLDQALHDPLHDDGIDPAEQSAERPWQIAIVGRPNVGKSTLLNRMVGSERMVTGPEAGITRDAISVDWTWRSQPIRLFDTAGLRRKSRVAERLEKLSVTDTLRAIQFAETVILMIDAGSPFDKQDLHIADLVYREGRAMVIAVNKWDMVSDQKSFLKHLSDEAERLLPQMRGIPILPVSAKTGRGISGLMNAIARVRRDWTARVKTPDLNRWLEEVERLHPPPAVRGRRIRLRYMAQIKTRPPTFVVFASRAEHLPDSYKRYLVNGLRDAFGLAGVPIRLSARKPDNPFAGRKKS